MAPPNGAQQLQIDEDDQYLKDPGTRRMPVLGGASGRLGQVSGWISKYRDYVAEFWGTFILVSFGCGSIAMVQLNDASNSGDFFSINVGWGFGLMMGIYVAGSISGAHLNPAVSVAMAMFGKFQWRKVPGYILAQFLGSFMGAAVIYIVYSSALDNKDKGQRIAIGENSTAGIFATFPAEFVSPLCAFLNETLGTAFLLFIVSALNDPNNNVPKDVAPIIIGFLLLNIGVCFGWQTGYALNPARDFGPRLFTMIIGYGGAVFTAYNNYFWIPLIAPFIGAIGGVALYDFTLA
jgi:MIP family channel proteins